MSKKIDRIRKLNRQARELCKKDAPSALRLATQAEALLATCPQAQLVDQYESLRTQTFCLDTLSRPAEALPIGLKASQLAEEIGDKSLIGAILNILGRIYFHIDDFPTSMDCYLKALKIVQTGNYPEIEISLINGLGLVQYGLENYDESLRYFKSCLELATEDDFTGRADANNNISYVLYMLGRGSEALEYGMAALSLFNFLGTKVGKMETLHSLGAIHISLGNYDQAMAFLQEGIQLARQNNSQLLEIHFILEISRILQIYGKLDEAEHEILTALQTAEKINSLTNISLTHERLVEIYKAKQEYALALEHFETFHATFKKIFNDKSDRRVKNLEILHQVDITRKQADLFREMAGTDFLTNLVNRRRFFEIAEAAFQQKKIERRSLAIMMLDIDHFKKVNDLYGHKAGDEVLAAVAATIKKSMRQGDVAGRYGGEEFIAMVLDTTPEHCFLVAERIRQAVAQLSIPIQGAAVQVTISLGLANIMPENTLPLDAWIDNADQALYQAKQQGRNRVVEWGVKPV